MKTIKGRKRVHTTPILVLALFLALFIPFMVVLATEGDEDITLWNKTFTSGGSNIDTAYGVAYDSQDSVYVAGLGRHLVTATSADDWWIKKFYINGTEELTEWNKTISSGGNDDDEARNIGIDSNDNIFVVGYGTHLATATSQYDWWIKKFNRSGTENTTHWNKNFTAGSENWYDIAYDIAFDSDDNVYVVGAAYDIVNGTSGYDWWIKKFYSNGTEEVNEWNKTFYGPGSVGSGNDTARGIAIDSNDDIYVVGYADYIIDTNSKDDWWIKKFNRSGTENTTHWNKTYSINNDDDYAYDVAIDSNDNVYVVGGLDSNLQWWMKKFYSNSTEEFTQWNKSFYGDYTYHLAWGVDVDSNDGIYIVGHMGISLGVNQWLIKKYNTSGFENLTHWNQTFAEASGLAQGIAIDSENNISVVGTGSNLVTPTSNTDWWIKKFEGNGNTPPQIDSIILNTTDPTSNNSDQNITAYANTSDVNGDTVKVIYNWLLNGTPIAVLNMPFEMINGTDTDNGWDYSGNENNGSEQGSIVWNSTGGFDGNGSYKFDGNNDYIEIPDSPEFTMINGYSVSAWIMLRSVSAIQNIAGQWGFAGAGNAAWRFGISSTRYLQIDNHDASSTATFTDSTTQLAYDTWYHVVGVYDGGTSGTNAHFYVNGALSEEGTISKTPQNSGYFLGIGAIEAMGSDEYFKGKIDEVLVFNRSLSSSQIWALYTNQSNVISSDETTPGQNWTVDVTPNDGREDGAFARSNQVIVKEVIAYPNCIDTTGNWTVNNNYTLNQNVICANVTVSNSSTLTVNGSYQINATNIIVETGSVISANSKGCPSTQSPVDSNTCADQYGAMGIGEADGQNGTDWGTTGGGGAGYGGAGGDSSDSQWGGLAYGDPLAPIHLGSGGGNDSGNNGGTGGGAIHLVVTNNLTLDGIITADGGNGGTTGNAFDAGGGGSGGSIYVETYIFGGRGNLSAKGGDGADKTTDGGGGGGGRIAVYYNHSNFEGIYASKVTGGSGQDVGEEGDSGTLGFIDRDNNTLIVVDGWEFQNNANYTNITFYPSTLIRINKTVQVNVTAIIRNGSLGITCQNTNLNFTLKSVKDLNLSNTTIKDQGTKGTDCKDVNIYSGNDIFLNNVDIEVTDNVTINRTLRTSVSYTNLSINSQDNFTFRLTNQTLTLTSSSITTTRPNYMSLGDTRVLNLVSTTFAGNMNWSLVNLTIDNASTLSADSFGCPSSQSPVGSYTCADQYGTRGPGEGDGQNGTDWGTTGGGGAGYGGAGGDSSDSQLGGLVYGSALAPIHLGSGGGNDSGNNGGTGGGAIHLVVTNNLTLDGIVTADGGNGGTTGNAFDAGGGGSGGSIYVETYIFGGRGNFSSKGGDGRDKTNDGGGGGGGRIAVYYNLSTFEGINASKVTGGDGPNNAADGEAGTLFAIDLDNRNIEFIGGVEFNKTDFYPKGSIKELATDNFTFVNVTAIESTLIRFIGDVIFKGDNINFSNSIIDARNTRLDLRYNHSFEDSNSTYNDSFWLSLEKTNISRIEFIPSLSSISNISFNTNLSSNLVFVNSSNDNDFNVSANITLYGIMDGLNISIDTDDDGNFDTCPGTICTQISYGGGTLEFNVTRFTSYKASEIIDSTAPNITWITPTNVSNYTIASSNQTFNISIAELNSIDTVYFMFDNSSGKDFNVTPTNQSGFWTASYNVSTLAEGTHLVTVYANDTSNNVNNTQRIIINIDNTVPVVTNINPSNGTNLSSGNYSFNATVTNGVVGIQTVILMFNTNATPFNITTINVSGVWNYNVNVSTIEEGLHTVIFFANDTVNNINQTETSSFYVDKNWPNVSITTADFSTTDTTPDIQFFFNDTVSLTANCSLYVNNSLNSSAWVANGTTSTLTTQTLAIADYFAFVTCVDGSGNIGNSTTTVNFTIQETPSSSSSSSGGGSSSSSSSTSTGGPGDDGDEGDDSPVDTPVETPTEEEEEDGDIIIEIVEEEEEEEEDVVVEEVEVTEDDDEDTEETERTPETQSEDEALVGKAIAIPKTVETKPISQEKSVKVRFKNTGRDPLVITPEIKENLPVLENEDKLIEKIKNIEKVESLEKIEAIKYIEKEEVQFITGKTAFLGGSKECGTSSGILYSEDIIRARILKHRLIDDEDIIVQPNETVEKDLRILAGISAKKTPVNLAFKSMEKEVSEKFIDTPEEIIGTAIDILPDSNLFDVYVLIPSIENGKGSEHYSVEVSINQKANERYKQWETGIPIRLSLTRAILRMLWGDRTKFSELYGSYKVRNDEGFIFAQQFAYSPNCYSGEYIIQTKVHKGNYIVAENSFLLNFDTKERIQIEIDGQTSSLGSEITAAATFDYNNLSINPDISIKSKMDTGNLLTGAVVEDNSSIITDLGSCGIVLIIFLILYLALSAYMSLQAPKKELITKPIHLPEIIRGRKHKYKPIRGNLESIKEHLEHLRGESMDYFKLREIFTRKPKKRKIRSKTQIIKEPKRKIKIEQQLRLVENELSKTELIPVKRLKIRKNPPLPRKLPTIFERIKARNLFYIKRLLRPLMKSTSEEKEAIKKAREQVERISSMIGKDSGSNNELQKITEKLAKLEKEEFRDRRVRKTAPSIKLKEREIKDRSKEIQKLHQELSQIKSNPKLEKELIKIKNKLSSELIPTIKFRTRKTPPAPVKHQTIFERIKKKDIFNIKKLLRPFERELTPKEKRDIKKANEQVERISSIIEDEPRPKNELLQIREKLAKLEKEEFREIKVRETAPSIKAKEKEVKDRSKEIRRLHQELSQLKADPKLQKELIKIERGLSSQIITPKRYRIRNTSPKPNGKVSVRSLINARDLKDIKEILNRPFRQRSNKGAIKKAREEVKKISRILEKDNPKPPNELIQLEEKLKNLDDPSVNVRIRKTAPRILNQPRINLQNHKTIHLKKKTTKTDLRLEKELRKIEKRLSSDIISSKLSSLRQKSPTNRLEKKYKETNKAKRNIPSQIKMIDERKTKRELIKIEKMLKKLKEDIES